MVRVVFVALMWAWMCAWVSMWVVLCMYGGWSAEVDADAGMGVGDGVSACVVRGGGNLLMGLDTRRAGPEGY